MRSSFKLMLGCVVAAQAFTAGVATAMSLQQGENICGPPKGLGCGGCDKATNKCFVVWCDKTKCNIETFRRVPGSISGGKGVLFRVRGPAN
jgi:hypothetical protein